MAMSVAGLGVLVSTGEGQQLDQRSQEINTIVREVWLTMNVWDDWETMLEPAPTSINVLGNMMLLAADQNFALNQKPPAGFVYITAEGSFKACLVQVSNAACAAFQTANEEMGVISANSKEIVGIVKSIIDILSQNTETIERELPGYLEELTQIMVQCSSSAMAVKHKFDVATNLIDEIVVAGTAEQDVQVKRNDEEAARKERLIANEKREEAELQKIEEECKDYETKTTQQYQAVRDAMPTAVGMFSASAIESVLRVFEETAPLNALRFIAKTAGVAASLSGKALDLFKEKKSSANESNQDEKSATKENQTHTVNDDACSEESVDNNTKQMNEISQTINVIRTIIDSLTPTGGWPADVTNKMQENLASITDKLASFVWNTALQGLPEECAHLCGNVLKKASEETFSSTTKESLQKLATDLKEKAQRVSDKISASIDAAKKHHLLKPTKPEFETQRTSMAQSYVELSRNNVDSEMKIYEDIKEDREKKNAEMREKRNELLKTLADLQTANISLLDIPKIIQYLKQGLTCLEEVKEHWLRLSLFFKKISTIIEVPMKQAVKTFSRKAVERQTAGRFVDDRMRKNLHITALKAIAFAMGIDGLTTTYVRMSEVHILPKITQINRLLYIDEDKRDCARQTLNDEHEKAQLELRKLLLDNKNNFTQIATRMRLLSLGFETNTLSIEAE